MSVNDKWRKRKALNKNKGEQKYVHVNRVIWVSVIEKWHLSPELKEVRELDMWIFRFLNLSTIDIMGWIILLGVICPMHWRMFTASLASIY